VAFGTLLLIEAVVFLLVELCQSTRGSVLRMEPDSRRQKDKLLAWDNLR
jgi:hypothetical protein